MYVAGSLVCHQLPERSFHVAGFQLPVCARCTGAYLGAAAGLVVWVARWPPARAATLRGSRALATFAAAAVPTLLTLATSAGGVWDPGNLVRAALALPLGVAAGAVVAAVAAGDLR